MVLTFEYTVDDPNCILREETVDLELEEKDYHRLLDSYLSSRWVTTLEDDSDIYDIYLAVVDEINARELDYPLLDVFYPIEITRENKRENCPA